MYIPLNYEQLNLIEGSYQPSMIKAHNNASYDFWVRSLFQRACSVLEFNLPENWNGSTRDFFYYCLFKIGYVGVINTNKYGLIFQPGNLSGFSIFYQPTNFLVSSPADQELNKNYKIGSDCEIIKLTPDYKGIFDIINFYAEKLSVLCTAIDMSLVNNKFAFILGAKNKPASMALKKMFDKINAGEPAVIFDQLITDDVKSKDLPFTFWDRNLKNSYLTTEQLDNFNELMRMFDNEVGIPTASDKKERLVTSEAESKTIESASRSIVWLDTLNASIDKVNKLFPDANISVKLRYDMKGDNVNADNTYNYGA